MQTPELPAPTGVAPSEQDERTRNRLLRAAVGIFDRKGYATASVREIAEAAGVAKPALYYHFGSKEGLLVAILNLAAHEFTEAMAQAVARPGTARQRVTALCEDVYALFERHVPLARVAYSVFLGPPDIAPVFDLRVFESRLREALLRLIEDGQSTGEFRRLAPADVALAVVGVLDATAGRQLHPVLEPVGVDGLRRLLNVIFDGILSERQS